MTTEKPYRYLRDTSESMWQHTIGSTIGRIDTKANTLEMIARGCRGDTTIEAQISDLHHIADELRIQVRELFIELERLQNTRAAGHHQPKKKDPEQE